VVINTINKIFKTKFGGGEDSVEPKEFDYIDFINTMKKKKQGLMSKKQYKIISKELATVAPCNLLVFGLGEDSYLWRGINIQGDTVFIEDNKEWIESVNNGTLNVHLVEYTTSVEDYEEIGFDENQLKMELPESVLDKRYDFIIVDAPLGHQPPRPYNGPGRMSSIYTANKLLKKGGVAVIDDMGRKVEREYSNHYFGKENRYAFIENKVGFFRKV
jgi:uncharacterized protein (TIGR01627 family)